MWIGHDISGKAQSEYATDVVFESSRDLQDLMPRLVDHSSLPFSAKDVMSFLGRKLTGHFQGEVVTDRSTYPCKAAFRAVG
jgi:hypothetical protein